MRKATKRNQTKTNQKLPGPGHQGRLVQKKDHPGQAFWVCCCFPFLFHCVRGGIWPPPAGASILEIAQIPWSICQKNGKSWENLEPKMETTKQGRIAAARDYGKKWPTNQMPSAPSNQLGKTLKSECNQSQFSNFFHCVFECLSASIPFAISK